LKCAEKGRLQVLVVQSALSQDSSIAALAIGPEEESTSTQNSIGLDHQPKQIILKRALDIGASTYA
jgi:hypothetical protein